MGLSDVLKSIAPAPRPGYRLNRRAGTMPVCQRCGALVAYESQDLHTRWHEAEAR